MEKDYINILAIYPGMYASPMQVRIDTWEHYMENYLNVEQPGNCFLPGKDMDGDSLFIDMTKLLAFYVLKKEPVKKAKKVGAKKQK